MANRYWCKQNASNAWNATAPTNWWDSSDTGAGANAAVPTSADAVFFDGVGRGANDCTISSNVTAQSVNCTGYVNNLIQNTFSQLTASGSVTFVAGMSYTPAISLSTTGIVFTTTATLTTGGKALVKVGSTTSSFTITMGDDWNFAAGTVCSCPITNTLNMAGFAIIGNSATNRVLISSGTLGTARSITNATSTAINNVDFRDIAFTSASDLDLTNGQANSIGDCGGNSITGGGTNLTFTTALTPNTITGNSVSLSNSVAQWDGGRVPLPQDNVVVNMTAGQTLTVDMPRLGSDLSFTTATLLALGNAVTSYGSVNLTNMSGNPSGAFSWTFESQARSGTITLTSAGKAFINQVNFAVYNSTLQLLDAFLITGSSGVFSMQAGTFDANDNSVTFYRMTLTPASSTINMGNGLWTLTATTAVSVWVATGITINAEGSTILISGTDANAKTFVGAGKTYNNLQFYGTGSGAIIFTSSNTFASIKCATGHEGTKTLTFTGNTTTTINDLTGFGQGANLITINSPTLTTVPPKLAFPGNANFDYLNIQGVNVSSGKGYYGTHSTDGLGLNFGGQATSGDYVSAANSAGGNQWSGSTTFSVEAWIVARSLGSGSAGRILNKRTIGSVTGYVLDLEFPLSLNTPSFYGDFSGGSVTALGSTITFNSLNHIVGVWTGTQLIIYTNSSAGTPVATSGTPLDDTSLLLGIGNRAEDRIRTFDGQIYAVRIYRNVALTSGNVTTLYNAGVKGVNPLGNATAEYLMNDGSGATVVDSISANNGTITGATWANTGWNYGSPGGGSMCLMGVC